VLEENNVKKDNRIGLRFEERKDLVLTGKIAETGGKCLTPRAARVVLSNACPLVIT
jgi:hypothetical protein